MRTWSFECIIYFEYIVYARPASFQIQDGGSVIRVYALTRFVPCAFLEWIAQVEKLVEKGPGHAFDNESMDKPSSNNETQ